MPEPLGSAEALALTPRPEPNLELLELEPNNVVVSQATYDRLVSDVTAIHALEPTTVPFLERHDGKSIQLQGSDQAAEAFCRQPVCGVSSPDFTSDAPGK